MYLATLKHAVRLKKKRVAVNVDFVDAIIGGGKEAVMWDPGANHRPSRASTTMHLGLFRGGLHMEPGGCAWPMAEASCRVLRCSQ